jgi:predicted nucleotidyltransferase
MRSWKEALKEHKQVLEQAGYKEENILGVFCYGSQNYGISTEHSDWDTKAIIIPSYSDLIFKPATSKELHLPNGEHCEVKDIREFVKNLYKQNINFVEILFTDYFVLNETFKDIWEETFMQYKEDIARYDVNKAILSMSHQAYHTLKQAENGANPCKKLANVARLIYFLQRYLRGEDYLDCLRPALVDHNRIYKLKTQPKTIASYETTIEMFKMILEGYKEANYEYYNCEDIQKELESMIKKAIMKMIKLIS